MDVGLRHSRQRIRQGDTVSAEVLSQQSNLVEGICAAGRDAEVQDSGYTVGILENPAHGGVRWEFSQVSQNLILD